MGTTKVWGMDSANAKAQGQSSRGDTQQGFPVSQLNLIVSGSSGASLQGRRRTVPTGPP